MLRWHPSPRVDDRFPQVFAPHVAPDPEVEQKLKEKLERSRRELRDGAVRRFRPPDSF